MSRLATAAAEGAAAGGARVRLLRVADHAKDPLAPGRTAPADPGHPVASPGDVLWADGLVLATPTYFGNVSAPFKEFLDSTARLWAEGRLTDRVVTAMTSAECAYGGREATLLSLYQTAYHWGSWVLGADPRDEESPGADGNPYGLSTAYRRGSLPQPSAVRAAWALGRRLAGVAARSAARPRSAVRLPSVTSPGVLRPVRVTVVHHADGTAVPPLAQECAAGARDVGAEVRIRRVPEFGAGGTRASGQKDEPAGGRADGSAKGHTEGERYPSRSGQAWGAPRAPLVADGDLAWADAVIFGAPSRLGALSAPLLDFAQTLETAEARGLLAGKAASAFTVTPRPHAGSESALLTFHPVLLHAGAVVVPPGYTDPAVFAAGGNPYGCAYPLTGGARPSPQALRAVRHQGRRIALVADRLRRPAPDTPPARSPAAAAVTGRSRRTQHEDTDIGRAVT